VRGEESGSPMQAVLTHLLLAPSSASLSLRFPRDLDFVTGRIVFCTDEPGTDEDNVRSILTSRAVAEFRDGEIGCGCRKFGAMRYFDVSKSIMYLRRTGSIEREIGTSARAFNVVIHLGTAEEDMIV
jgi:hypothetical protein